MFKKNQQWQTQCFQNTVQILWKITWERKRKKYPAYGKRCNVCNGTNHFEAVCNNFSKKFSQRKHRKKTVHHIETSDLSDSDGDTDYAVCTLNIEEDEQSPQSISNKVHATMLVCEQEVTFQLDSGATCNILPSSTIPSLPPLQPLGKYIWRSQTLEMVQHMTPNSLWLKKTVCRS